MEADDKASKQKFRLKFARIIYSPVQLQVVHEAEVGYERLAIHSHCTSPNLGTSVCTTPHSCVYSPTRFSSPHLKASADTASMVQNVRAESHSLPVSVAHWESVESHTLLWAPAGAETERTVRWRLFQISI